DAHQLNVYLLEWPVPVTGLIALGLGLRRGRLDAGLRPAAAYLLGLVGMLFFYFHRDTLFGPRFLFSALGPILVLLARALVALSEVKRPLPGARMSVGDVALIGTAVPA